MKDVAVLPVLQDNFVFCLRNGTRALLVDPGEAKPVLDFLAREKLALEGILITHHHHDHIGGVPEILRAHPAPVWAPERDTGRFPFPMKGLSEGETLEVAGFRFRVLELPGHTLDHLAYFESERNWLFSGDVLFGYGCGRLFEGSFEQAYESLHRLKKLPDETQVFCTHEYTLQNLRFLESLARSETEIRHARALREMEEKRLAEEGRTIPLSLGQQKAENPFLRAESLDEFRDLRLARNQF